MKRRSRNRLALLTVAIWLGILAWHVKREYFQPFAVRLAEASASLTPTSAYYSVKLGDATVGYAASRIDTLPDGFVLEDDVRLRIFALGSEVPSNARTQVRLGRRLELRDFTFSLRSSLGDFHVEGLVDGDSTLKLEVATGGDEQTLSVPTGGTVLLPQIMPIHFVLGHDPRPGETFTFEIFDPSILERQKVRMEVVDQEVLIYPDSADYDEAAGAWVPQRHDTVETWHVRQIFGGVELEAWLDPDGRIVRATSPMGYTIERTAFEIAWNEYRALADRDRGVRDAASDIIERTAISVGAELPHGDRIARLAVRLKNVDLSGFDLNGERQRLRGDILTVEVRPPTGHVSYRLPADHSDWYDELSATPLIQVEDPEIRRAAQEITKGTTDPLEAARLLTDWVYGRLDKRITMSVPSARQVLDEGVGDCNEHTVLYVALARAVGLPARTSAGLVLVNDRFYYHAWPEVWLDRWVPVDPTLGQFPADASHLRFVVGGLARQVELVRLIGQLQLDIVSVEEK